MKTAYLDCFAGISGDMTLGALVELGFKTDELSSILSEIFSTKIDIRSEIVRHHGITGTGITIIHDEQKKARHLSDIVAPLESSGLPRQVVEKSCMMFQKLASAEAEIHGTAPEKIHFHEVGAIDSIADIVGVVLGFHTLGFERIICSPLRTGKGFVRCDHGTMPVPAPATAKILEGVPVYSGDIEGEFTTPTGALIASCLSNEFGSMPEMTIESSGLGAGSRKTDIPNLLRIFTGSTKRKSAASDEIIRIETNIDDMNPEILAFVMERLMEKGALDTFVIPATGKKQRISSLVTVLSDEKHFDDLARVLLSETSTAGIRYSRCERMILERSVIHVDTPHGKIEVKCLKQSSGEVYHAPEFSSCMKTAKKTGQPLWKIYNDVLKALA